MFDFIGDAFEGLVSLLGSILAAFFDLFHPALSDGWSYGMAIILLTILINIVVFPLTLKQTRSTRAFTALQPTIKKIQAEYKDNPQEMQKRLMAAQREAGATPGGCLLPLLVQMPIWIALFRLLQDPLRYMAESALGVSIEAGGGTFLGMTLGTTPSAAMALGLTVAWPYLLLIGVMVGVQYVQQWHATYGSDRPDQPGAGAQQAVTKIMPLFIGFISWNFPAGLVVYWTTSNLFRLGQQALIFKIDGRPSQPAAAKDEVTMADDDTQKKPQPGAADKRRRRRRK